jgi:hypothetical protein
MSAAVRLAPPALLAVFLAAGCGSPTPTPVVPASGVVLLEGNPVAGVVVTFAPALDLGNSGPSASASTGPDGKFTLTTGDRTGAPEGWYRAILSDPNQINAPQGEDAPKPRIHPIYQGRGTPLLFKVEAGKLEPFQLRLLNDPPAVEEPTPQDKPVGTRPEASKK